MNLPYFIYVPEGDGKREAESEAPPSLEELLEKARTAELEDDFGNAERLAREALHLLKDNGNESKEIWYRCYFTLACIYGETEFFDEAEKYFGLAGEIKPDEPYFQFREGRFRLNTWEYDRARVLLSKCGNVEELRPRVVYHRAILEELEGNFDPAESLYAEAEKLDPDTFFRPCRIKTEDVDVSIGRLIDSLPVAVKQAIGNTVLELVEIPDPKIDKYPGMGPFMWGYFHGYSAGYLPGPFKYGGTGIVRVFKRNIERHGKDRQEVEKYLKECFLHEIGHILGFDEQGLKELGL